MPPKLSAIILPIIVNGDTESGSTNYRFKFYNDHPLSSLAEILFTKRTEEVLHHKGQISFPGGMQDSTDASLKETALREFEEELGVDRCVASIIGELPETPTVVTNIIIKPYIAVIDSLTFKPKPNAAEISETFSVPINHLLDPLNQQFERYNYNQLWYELISFHYKKHKIWGATARILDLFLKLKLD